MKTTIRSLVLLTLMAVFTVNIQAQQRYNNADRPGFNRQDCRQAVSNQQGPQHQRMMAVLDLSEEQQSKIQDIHLNGQKVMLPMRTTLQEKRAEMRTLSVGENYDEAKVSQLADEIGQLQANMMKIRASHQEQIKEILTEEQRIKFDNFHLNRGPKMGTKRGGWNR